MSSAIHGRHRATPAGSTLSKAVAIGGGSMGRKVAVVAAASGLMLSFGAPAQASVTVPDAGSAPASAPAAVVPAAVPAVAQAPAAPAAAATHTVKPGDTLSAIANQYDLSLSEVLSANGLSLSSVIFPGDTIALSGAATAPAAPAAPVQVAPAAPAAPAATFAAQTPAPASAPDNSGIQLASAEITPISGASAAPVSSGGNSAIVASAQSQLGAMQDCTVLVEKALRAAGVAGVGDESPESLAAFGTQVSNPQPGDIVYYSSGGTGYSHIAVYIGGGEAIHSGFNGGQTVIASVNVGSGPVFYRV